MASDFGGYGCKKRSDESDSIERRIPDLGTIASATPVGLGDGGFPATRRQNARLKNGERKMVHLLLRSVRHDTEGAL
jgi:hypothetical protein